MLSYDDQNKGAHHGHNHVEIYHAAVDLRADPGAFRSRNSRGSTKSRRKCRTFEATSHAVSATRCKTTAARGAPSGTPRLPGFVVVDMAKHHDSTKARKLCAKLQTEEIEDPPWPAYDTSDDRDGTAGSSKGRARHVTDILSLHLLRFS